MSDLFDSLSVLPVLIHSLSTAMITVNLTEALQSVFAVFRVLTSELHAIPFAVALLCFDLTTEFQ